MGMWVSIPAALNATNAPLSLLEIAEQLRVVLYGNYLHLFGKLYCPNLAFKA